MKLSEIIDKYIVMQNNNKEKAIEAIDCLLDNSVDMKERRLARNWKIQLQKELEQCFY